MTTSQATSPKRPGERVFLGLGSNLGDRAANLRLALCFLEERTLRVVRRSSVWETAAVGPVAQPDFLNQVAELADPPPPVELLETCLEIESALGRVRTVEQGPRVIDLDLLLYGERRIEAPRLTIPHPRLAERLFVLAPLAELAPDLRHPTLDKSIGELSDTVTRRGTQQVSIFSEP